MAGNDVELSNYFDTDFWTFLVHPFDLSGEFIKQNGNLNYY